MAQARGYETRGIVADLLLEVRRHLDAQQARDPRELASRIADHVVIVDGDERARAQRFMHERDRRQYIAAHALLRILLQRQLDTIAKGGDPAGVAFDEADAYVKFDAGQYLEEGSA